MKGIEISRHFELSKELEIINFRALQENQLVDAPKEITKHWISNETKLDDEGVNKIQNNFKSFQKAMKVVIVWGQCIGLNPVTGILQNDVSKMRFNKLSVKFLFALTMALAQVIGTVLCVYRLFKNTSSLTAICFVTFYSTACFTTISFIRIASKWPTLMKELIKAKLDEYIDPTLTKRSKIACAVFMGMALMEHVMSIVSRIVRILECASDAVNVGEIFVKASSPWLYDLNVPYIEWHGITVQSLNLVATATWNYADMFIVCISLYLTSILEQINMKIAATASKNYVPASTWMVLREDYTRATKLVKLFDDMFSGLVVIIFANDLFFICSQLYNILANGIKATQLSNKMCPGREDSLLRTYVYPAYLTYSTIYLFARFLTVAIVASGVNTSSLMPLRLLYAVPSTSYCKEVERFQNQVNGDIVALSGLHFFYITRDLVLSVAGTIVTYELVLLQFSTDDK